MWLPTHYEEVIQFGMIIWGVGMVINEDAIRYSFNLSSKVHADSPVYSSSYSNLLHVYLHITSLFCVILSLCLDVTWRLLMVFPLEVDLNPDHYHVC